MRQKTKVLLDYYDKLEECVEELSPAERLAFDIWDRHHPDGVKTSAWPGFAMKIGERPDVANLPPPEPTRTPKARIPGKLRWAIWERDDFTCQECGTRQNLSVDHIIPEAKGGTLDPDNLQTLCKRCNSVKGARG